MPTPIRKMRGNPGKRRMNKREPEPEASTGDFPDWLPEGRPREMWGRLFPMLRDMKVMTVADETALAMLCIELGDYVWATEQINTLGRTYEFETKAGDKSILRRPEVGIKNAAWANAARMLAAFGMNPADRTKVQQIVEHGRDEFAEMFGV